MSSGFDEHLLEDIMRSPETRALYEKKLLEKLRATNSGVALPPPPPPTPPAAEGETPAAAPEPPKDLLTDHKRAVAFLVDVCENGCIDQMRSHQYELANGLNLHANTTYARLLEEHVYDKNTQHDAAPNYPQQLRKNRNSMIRNGLLSAGVWLGSGAAILGGSTARDDAKKEEAVAAGIRADIRKLDPKDPNFAAQRDDLGEKEEKARAKAADRRDDQTLYNVLASIGSLIGAGMLFMSIERFNKRERIERDQALYDATFTAYAPDAGTRKIIEDTMDYMHAAQLEHARNRNGHSNGHSNGGHAR